MEKKLHNMGTEELIQIIMSLYRSNKSVEQSINLQIIGDAYHDAIVAAGQDEELYKLWKDRLESVLHDFAGFGWGMEEYIYEEYYSLPWIQEDNG